MSFSIALHLLETESLTEPEAPWLARLAGQGAPQFCLYLPSLGLHVHVSTSVFSCVCARDRNTSTQACSTSMLALKPSFSIDGTEFLLVPSPKCKIFDSRNHIWLSLYDDQFIGQLHYNPLQVLQRVVHALSIRVTEFISIDKCYLGACISEFNHGIF